MDGESLEGLKQNMEKGRGLINDRDKVVGFTKKEREDYEKRQNMMRRSPGRPPKNSGPWRTVGN